MELEEITGDNWRSFTESSLAVLVIGKTDCPNCATWSDELVSFLSDNSEYSDVRFGKVLLDEENPPCGGTDVFSGSIIDFCLEESSLCDRLVMVLR